jgi:hypothetical protein
MPIPFRSDLESFLTEFIEHHRGVRAGKMFGLPAGYVGRRLFACLMEDGIIVRLPDEIAKREMKKGGIAFSRRGRELGGWVMYRPRTAAAARTLIPVLEIAVRNVAERQVEDLTGVKLTSSRVAHRQRRSRE